MQSQERERGSEKSSMVSEQADKLSQMTDAQLIELKARLEQHIKLITTIIRERP